VSRAWIWSLVLVAGVLAAAFGGLALYNRAMLTRDIDRLFEEILANGDAAEAYRRADAALQRVYSPKEFVDVAAAQPGLFRRDSLSGVEVRWLKDTRDLYAMVRTRIVDIGEVDFYCRNVGGEQWRLVGIAPVLPAAIPGDLNEVNTGRR
jgi:hypothetical protein